MIKVIKENIVPTKRVTCDNCYSVLEYSNPDIHYQPLNITIAVNVTRLQGNYITCPVCNNEVPVEWIKLWATQEK